MNKYERENIKHNFTTQIVNSWTYNKLTDNERKTITNEINELKLYANNDKQCYYILNKVYHSFLLGLGYNATDWRE